MEKKHLIAIGIALQTQVLKTCPVHRKIYFDDEANPASAECQSSASLRSVPNGGRFAESALERG